MTIYTEPNTPRTNIYGRRAVTGIDGRYHYIYRITNIVEGKHYYGKRTSKKHPHRDLGIKYFSSSTDKDFKLDQKTNPKNYKYKILQTFDYSDDAIFLEFTLHGKFAVHINPKFYNKAKQTLSRFGTNGLVTVMVDGEWTMIDKSLYVPGVHQTPSSGKVAVKDQQGNNFLVSKSDPLYITGILVPVSKGIPVSAEAKILISKANKGTVKTAETCTKLSNTMTKNQSHVGANNARHKWYYITPVGVFDSPATLEPELSLTRMKTFCAKNERKVTVKAYDECLLLQNLFTPEQAVGNTYKELGFARVGKSSADVSKLNVITSLNSMNRR
jgi:hypothetical protein